MIYELFRTFAADYEYKDEKKHFCMGAVIGISADAGSLVFTYS